MKIKPLFHYIVVERDEDIRQVGSIFLPESGTQKTYTGTVLAVGNGTLIQLTGQIMPMTLKPGDRVLFGEYSGIKMKLSELSEEGLKQDKEYIIMRENEIFGIIEEEDKDKKQIIEFDSGI